MVPGNRLNRPKSYYASQETKVSLSNIADQFKLNKNISHTCNTSKKIFFNINETQHNIASVPATADNLIINLNLQDRLIASEGKVIYAY